MSNLIRFELNRAGVAELLKSEQMGAALMEAAESRRPAGDYEVSVKNMGTRKIAIIETASDEAMKDNLENNTLLKAYEV